MWTVLYINTHGGQGGLLVLMSAIRAINKILVVTITKQLVVFRWGRLADKGGEEMPDCL